MSALRRKLPVLGVFGSAALFASSLPYRSAMAGAWAVALSIALTGIARAVTLSSSFERAAITTYEDQSVEDPCGSVTCPGLGSVSVAASSNSIQAQVSATATNAPALSASASGGGALNTFGTAEIDYNLEWLDPSGSGPIPTLVDLVLHTAASADATDVYSYASAAATFNIAVNPTTIIQPTIGTSQLVSIAGGAGPAGFGIYCQTHACNSPADFSGTLKYELSPNVLYSVQIAVTAITSDNEGFAGGSTLQSAEASLDPHIYLDPNFNIPGLTLELSQDLDNVVGSAATPLPAALPLFATGLGALGLLGWRRKRKAQAVGA